MKATKAQADMLEKQALELQEKLQLTYADALDGMTARIKESFAQFAKDDAKWQADVAAGKKDAKAYTAWRKDQALHNDRLKALKKTLTQDLTAVDKMAMAYVNQVPAGVYAEGMNFATYEIEHGAKANTSFTLYNKNTVMELVANEPDLLPQAAFDKAKDTAWNSRHVTSAVTQAVLQGQTVPQLAASIAGIAAMDQRAAMKAARTAITSAHSLGKLKGYERAADMGIGVKKQWLAALDSRTRGSHRHLDGETVGLDEEFSNGLKYPGDPDGPGSEVYNCRCTLVPVVDGIEYDEVERASKLGDMSYEEWKNGKEKKVETVTKTALHKVVQGSDIVGTWKRRPDEFDFEIEDVMDAQGYDGAPLVVDADEFDELVKDSGMVMQRVYSSDDEKTLDAYRRALYEGKWYVDCSVNGATHGQGMYCAPSWTGKVPDEVKESMRFYADFNARTGKEFSYVETMTMAKDSKTISWDDLNKNFMAYQEKRRKALMDSGPSDLGRGREEYVRRMLRDAGVPDDSVDDATTFLVGSSGLVPKDWDEMGEARGRLTQEVLGVVNSKRGDLSSKSMEIDDFARNYSQSDSSVPVEIEDPGSYAAMMGYDAVVVKGSGLGNEIVVLNRTKVIIKKPEGWK